jgi:hypothetical protein
MLEIERSFMLTSAGAIVAIAASIIPLDLVASSSTRDSVLKAIVLVATVARTSLQYVMSFEAYFPPD